MRTCRVCAQAGPFTPSRIKRRDWICTPCLLVYARQRHAARRSAGLPIGRKRPTPDLKRCPRCQELLPAASFLRDSNSLDGLRSSCRDCQRPQRRLDSARHRDKPGNREREKARLEWRRANGLVDRESERQRRRRSAQRYPERHVARMKVRHALIAGKLTKPETCQKCGQPDAKTGGARRSSIHAHHHAGYDRPLDVEWICITCHGREHRKTVTTSPAPRRRP